MTAPVSGGNLSVVVSYLAGETGMECVAAHVEGQEVFLAFDVDLAEHTRRRAHAVGAVHSRRLLHALWALPIGIAWVVASLDDCDVATLENEGAGFVEMADDVAERLSPPAWPGHGVGLGRRSVADALVAAGRFPPIYRRYGIGSVVSPKGGEALAAAENMGVGAILAAGTP